MSVAFHLPQASSSKQSLASRQYGRAKTHMADPKIRHVTVSLEDIAVRCPTPTMHSHTCLRTVRAAHVSISAEVPGYDLFRGLKSAGFLGRRRLARSPQSPHDTTPAGYRDFHETLSDERLRHLWLVKYKAADDAGADAALLRRPNCRSMATQSSFAILQGAVDGRVLRRVVIPQSMSFLLSSIKYCLLAALVTTASSPRSRSHCPA